MILMLGVAGSGKSTQSQLMASSGKYRWVYIGEVLRRHMHGKAVADMNAGKLLSDDMVIEYLEKEIAELGAGPEIIIDGFPRTVYQVDWLVGKHASSVYQLSAVVHIEVSKSVVIERLANRGRPDDTESAINARFAEYDVAIRPILNDLHAHGVPIVTVDGSKEPLEVFADVMGQLKRL